MTLINLFIDAGASAIIVDSYTGLTQQNGIVVEQHTSSIYGHSTHFHVEFPDRMALTTENLEKIMKKSLVCIWLIIEITLCKCQDLVVYGGVTDDGIIGGGTQPTEISKTLYKSVNGKSIVLWRGDGAITQREVSKDGKYVVAVTEAGVEKGIAVDGSHDFKIVILDMNGATIFTIDDGVYFSLDPKGDELAFVRGLRSSEYGLTEVDCGVFDVNTKKQYVLPFKTRALNWSEYDRRIYFRDKADGLIKAYDNTSKLVSKTELRGIFLSPDGSHYFDNGGESGFKLFTITNHDVTEDFKKVTGVDARVSLVADWTNKNSLLVRNGYIVSERNRMNIVFDPTTKNVSKFSGKVVGMSTSGSNAFLLEDHNSVKAKAIIAK